MAQRAGMVEVLGCSTVAGNTDVEHTTRNTLRKWEWLNLPVPVASEAAKPLINPLSTGPLIHGDDGLGNSGLGQPQSRKVSETAADVLLRISHEQKGKLTPLTTGPLTNIARSLLGDPGLSGRLERIFVMGATRSTLKKRIWRNSRKWIMNVPVS